MITRLRELDLLVVGELNGDLILTGDVAPAFGQVEKLVDDAVLTIGSSSAIFACGAARLGLAVGFVGKVGDDEFGRFMVRQLVERGIETSDIVTDPKVHTGLSVILSEGVDRAILTYPGCIGALALEEIDFSRLERARHLHLGSYFLLERLRPDIPILFEAARDRGLTVSLDTNFDPRQEWDGGLKDALKRADLFLPNESELFAITGTRDLHAALASLSVPTVAVKLGARGAVARAAAGTVGTGVLPVEVVDTVGAGDSFDAGFIYGHLAGWDLDRTLRFASICGSLSTRAVGGTASQPTYEEAEQYL